MSTIIKNPFKVLLLPSNRKTLLGLILLVAVAGAAIVFGVNKTFVSNGLSGGSATYNASQVQEGSNASGTGDETSEYKQHIDEYNSETIKEARTLNPSAHPIPVFKNLPESSLSVDVVKPSEVETTPDTRTTPAVASTKPNKKIELCSTTDKACIENRAELSGCLVTDTQCLRDNFVIAMDACSITDGTCVSSTYGTGKSDQVCNANDMACILTQANKFQCSLADTQCLVARQIITPNECAPSDPVCQRQNITLAVNPSQGLMGYDAGGRSKNNAVIGQTSKQYSGEISPQFKQANTTSNHQNEQAAPAATKYDQAYMAQALNFVANKASSRKPVAITINVNNTQEANTSAIQQAPPPQNELNENGLQPIETDNYSMLINAGTQLFAVSNLALSSDYLGPVSLTILEAGPLYRAKLLGSMVHLEDKMRLELTRMVLASGEEFAVNAVALDLKTTYAAVASKVDHHYLSRFGWWGFGTVLSAVGNATQLVAQQVQRNTDGSVTEVISLTAQQQTRIALGSIGAEIGSLMRDKMNQPTTVHIDLHEELGVFFLTTVKRAH